jgi:16S rRNA (cytidine1402-2'-O)-methyltransferase
VLRAVDRIAAEDTRVTRRLLERHGIHTPLWAYRQNRRESQDALLEQLLQGQSVALVSDAGMPGISDPGAGLIARAVAAGVRVTPIPGATAAIAALAAAGLPTERFAFDGFPPRDTASRRAFFASLVDEPRTILLYESPRRLRETLRSLCEALGERRVVVARELTKPGEEFVRGSASEVLEHFTGGSPSGECVLLVAGAEGEPAEPVACEVAARLHELLAQGISPGEAVCQVAAAFRLPRRQVRAGLPGGKSGGPGGEERQGERGADDAGVVEEQERQGRGKEEPQACGERDARGSAAHAQQPEPQHRLREE